MRISDWSSDVCSSDLYYVATAGGGKVKAVGEQMMAHEYGLGFPKGSDLVAKVNAALAKMKADGRYNAIYKQWFGTEPPASCSSRVWCGAPASTRHALSRMPAWISTGPWWSTRCRLCSAARAPPYSPPDSIFPVALLSA